MKRIAIVAAFPGELKPLVRGWARSRENGIFLWRTRTPDQEWIAACGGIGGEVATRTLEQIEKSSGPVGAIFSVGWVGALHENVVVGDAYRLCGVIDADTGERFSTAAPTARLWLVTSRTFLSANPKRAMADRFKADLVDMEAAALARIALARGLPFDCVKGVSDGVNASLPEFSRFISSEGQLQWTRFLGYLSLRPWIWPALIRMGQQSGKAARNIGTSVLAILQNQTP